MDKKRLWIRLLVCIVFLAGTVGYFLQGETLFAIVFIAVACIFAFSIIKDIRKR